MEKISVIVPIYNVEEYLGRCIDSIIKQTYENLEIILVNDGSTDNSLDICYEYSKKDTRIKIINQKNMGLSGARNSGILEATGKYISFIDSDDYIDVDFYNKLVNVCESKNADIAICEYKRFKDSKELTHLKKNEEVSTYTSIQAITKLLKRDSKITNHAWNKLYKTVLFEDIRYPIGKKFEDLGTTYLLFEKANKICYIDSELYYYYYRENSIIGNLKIDGILDKMELVEIRNKYLENKYPEISGVLKEYYMYACIINTVDAYRVSTREILKDENINRNVAYIKKNIKKLGYGYFIRNFEKNIIAYAICIKINKNLMFLFCNKNKKGKK